MIGTRLGGLSPQPWKDVTAPGGWSWSLPLTIQMRGRRARVKPGWAIDGAAPTGKAYYVKTTGSDGYTGLSWAQAFRKISTALAQADVDVVYVEAGYYGRVGGGAVSLGTRSVSIIASGGRAVMSQDHELTSWTHVSNHYERALALHCGVVTDASNKDTYGDYQVLTRVADAATVDATPGSWWWNGSSTIYVRTFDDRAPDTNIHCYFGGQAPFYLVGDNKIIYAENIDVEGGKICADLKNSSATGGTSCYFNTCSFKYNADQHTPNPDNAVNIRGVDAYFKDCWGSKTSIDLFNYTARNTVNARGIEINCQAWDLGVLSTSQTAANGSSCHNSCAAVRIGCTYSRTYGPVISDINTSQGWTVCCIVKDSLSGGAVSTKFGLGTPGGGASSQWFDTCEVQGGVSYELYNGGGGSTVYSKNLQPSIPPLGNFGSITAY